MKVRMLLQISESSDAPTINNLVAKNMRKINRHKRHKDKKKDYNRNKGKRDLKTSMMEGILE